MISRITGILESIAGDTATVVVGALAYDIQLTGYASARLADQIDREVVLYTIQYLETPNQGQSFLPRMAGFLTPEDRAFFKLFTSCKGLGYRKGLRAMAMDTGTIAAAVADRDLGLLQSLPEIGRRTAETIVASLHGKVEAFVSAAAFEAGSAKANKPRQPGIAREALEVMLQLGENRTQAITWINQALADDDDRPADVNAVIERVYRIKAGG